MPKVHHNNFDCFRILKQVMKFKPNDILTSVKSVVSIGEVVPDEIVLEDTSKSASLGQQGEVMW